MSPKERFLQSKDDVAFLARVTEQPQFQRAIDHALLQQGYISGESARGEDAEARFHRQAGGREFANIFMSLWEMPKPASPSPDGNLQHSHVPWYKKLQRK